MQQGNAGVEWLAIFLDGSLVEQVRHWALIRELSGHLRELHRFIAAVVKIAIIARRERVNVVVGWMWKAHHMEVPQRRWRACLHCGLNWKCQLIITC